MLFPFYLWVFRNHVCALCEGSQGTTFGLHLRTIKGGGPGNGPAGGSRQCQWPIRVGTQRVPWTPRGVTAGCDSETKTKPQKEKEYAGNRILWPSFGKDGVLSLRWDRRFSSRVPPPGGRLPDSAAHAQLSSALGSRCPPRAHQTPAAGTTIPSKPCARGKSYHGKGCERRLRRRLKARQPGYPPELSAGGTAPAGGHPWAPRFRSPHKL